MARTSVDNTVQRVRRQLNSSFRHEVNVLQTNIDADDTTIIFTYDLPAQLIVGSILSIGMESLRVMTVDKANKQCTVIRGYFDTDGASHTAGDEISINARFEPNDILQAMVEELGSWGPQLFRVLSDTLSVADAAETVELPAAWINMYGIIDVRRNRTLDGSTAWPREAGRLIRGIAADFDGASTSGLLFRFINTVATGSMYFTVAMPFDTNELIAGNDLITDVGLDESMIDVLQMGAKIRLLLDAENNRTSRGAQDMPRRAEETPVAGFVPAAQLLQRYYLDRKQQEINKLRGRYVVTYT